MICPLPSLLPSSFVMCPYHINGDLSTDKRQALEKINPRWGGGGFCPFLSLKNITKMAGLQEKRIFLNCKLEDYPNFRQYLLRQSVEYKSWFFFLVLGGGGVECFSHVSQWLVQHSYVNHSAAEHWRLEWSLPRHASHQSQNDDQKHCTGAQGRGPALVLTCICITHKTFPWRSSQLRTG